MMVLEKYLKDIRDITLPYTITDPGKGILRNLILPQGK